MLRGNKNNYNDINEYMPSLLNPRRFKKPFGDKSLTQNSISSRCSLSLNRCNKLSVSNTQNENKIVSINDLNKENSQNIQNLCQDSKEINNAQNYILETKQVIRKPKDVEIKSFSGHSGSIFSAIDGLQVAPNKSESNSLPFEELAFAKTLIKNSTPEEKNKTLKSISPATELNENVYLQKDVTQYESIIYNDDKPRITVSFGVNNCESVNVKSKNSAIKRFVVTHLNNNTTVDCEVVEGSQLSTDCEFDETMNEIAPRSPKKIAVDIEIKKQLSIEDRSENLKVLILNTNAIDKLTHVIVQPPNYKLVKRKIFDKTKSKGSKRKALKSPANNGNFVHSDKLKQVLIDRFFPKVANDLKLKHETTLSVGKNGAENVVRDVEVMSKISGVADAVKLERLGRSSFSSHKKDNESPRSARLASAKREIHSPRCQEVKTSSSEAPRVPSPKGRIDSASPHSPRKNLESIQFVLPSKSKFNRTSLSTPKTIPHHKIVAGTHFAVDAFSYGEIPNVKHYFLTHFHSDHYCGLKKSFNKLLFCSKITSDLCMSRIGVSPKCIHVINTDETVRIEGVEVTAVDANHCPGAIMLVFTLPNGKALLHTGDFRASPALESCPVFWNKEIHTIYLDTTYCNPRYDFPTQDQSLEMALYILRQKKLTLEQAGKKFTSVLIVCGTYTIGKEKFFLGMARRVGCSVWACPEKDRVLQTVEGRSFSHAPPQSCQLHVVPMRDLTHEKLRSYLDSLQGAFSEVVAFKPSGWENGKNSSVEKDFVTIHGIPYSEHSSFSELIRFVKFLKPKQVIPTVDITGGVKAVQKYFPCPLVYKEDSQSQSRVTDYFSTHSRQQVPAVT